ncbi:serine hydrolase [Actinomadura sp. WMMB 499]|uniref:serine hydrolase domain-containing protein n=1 Tax=Actinomadura sp. WMMB 499 TaxID=1219491 RepID=UPI001245D620|nr:serine hydrolase domain-containing protein [Actinomadura sp. WMMB 499]QFG24511.1 beta-lactamase family protein [Actinomadura sp. WMMB 499]
MLRKTIAVLGLAGLSAAGTAVPAAPAAAHEHRPELRRLLHTLTTSDGSPGALAEIRDRHGRTVITDGVGDVRTGAPMPKRGHWRIGSVTKTFTATTVLLLVEDGLIELDAPVERYLPGVVRGNGNDGRDITVRHLLQHTSGLPDFLGLLGIDRVVENPLEDHEPEDLLALALEHRPGFDPGTGWAYSNTGYLVAGMIVEKVTGRSLGDEIERRVLGPLNLDGTVVPGDSPDLPGPHPRGYVRTPDGALLDRTRLNPSVAWAGGDLVSGGSDLNRFYAALLGGRVLRPATLREMQRTTEVSGDYGLGLRRVSLTCGAPVWGHAGDMIGFSTVTGATRDGRSATVMVNLKPGLSDAGEQRVKDAFDAALCEDA